MYIYIYIHIYTHTRTQNATRTHTYIHTPSYEIQLGLHQLKQFLDMKIRQKLCIYALRDLGSDHTSISDHCSASRLVVNDPQLPKCTARPQPRYLCMYVCMFVCIYVCIYVYMYVYMCICMYVCM